MGKDEMNQGCWKVRKIGGTSLLNWQKKLGGGMIKVTIHGQNYKNRRSRIHEQVQCTLDIVESLVSHKLSTNARFSTIQIGFIK